MKQMWIKRVAVFEYIYSCLISDNSDFSDAEISFKSKYNDDPWSLAVVSNFASNFLKDKNDIIVNLQSKWNYDQLDFILKAVIHEALAEFRAHATPKAVLIDQALITIGHYGDLHLKKIAHALLDKLIH